MFKYTRLFEFSCSFSDCTDTEQILERQVLTARFSGLILIFYQQSDVGFEPGMAVLCCPQIVLVRKVLKVIRNNGIGPFSIFHKPE